MQKLVKSIIFLTSLAAGTVFASEGEILLKMDLTKSSDGTPVKWVSNPAVNKVDKVQLCKDADGSAYLKAKNYIHYYYIALFPVNEVDRVVVTVKARGKGVIEPGYYIFDRMGGWSGQVGKKFPLKAEWQEFKADIPLTNKPGKDKYPFSYPASVRPLIQMTGETEFKDYAIYAVRNPILKNWIVDMPKSTGDVKIGHGYVILPGSMEYTGLKLLNAKNGDKADFTFKVRGKGRLTAGFYQYDLKYNPARKADKECGESLKSESIDSKEWKEIKFTFPVENVRKNEKILYVNRIREFFRTVAADGAALELEKADFQLSSEKIVVPEF